MLGGRIHFVISDNLNNYICRVLLKEKKNGYERESIFLK